MSYEDLPVVGRQQQLDRLVEVWGDTRAGARTVLLAAEAGGGKTTVIDTLVRTLADDPRPPQVVAGDCVPLGGEGLPFVPVAAVLRQLIERHGQETVVEWAGAGSDTLGALIPALGPAPTLDGERLRLFEAVGRLLERAAAVQPLLVVLEDLHWADEATRHLIRFLTQTLCSAQVCLLVSYRSDELHRRHPLRPFVAEIARLGNLERVELPRLTRTEVAELLPHVMQCAVSEETVTSVHERTEGVPYFVAELGAAMCKGDGNLPDNLRDALLVRILEVSAQAQQVVQAMSTAGTSVGHELLAEATGADPMTLDAALRELVDHGIVRADGTGYAFRHALLREAVHEDLLPGEHVRSHVQFAEALTRRPELVTSHLDSELAHHWFAAHRVQQAFEAALAATGSSPSPYEQLHMYERVLELWDQADLDRAGAPPHAMVLERAALTARRVSESARGLQLITAALAETDAETEPADAVRRLVIKASAIGMLTDASPGVGDSTAVAERAVELAGPTGDTPERVAALEMYAIQLMLAGRSEESEQVALEVIDICRRTGARGQLGGALNTLGATLVRMGREEEGLARLHESWQYTDGDDWLELRYHVNLSDALTTAGRPAEAAEVALAGYELSKAYGLTRGAGTMLLGNAAEALFDLGDWARARELLTGAFEIAPVGHHRVHVGLVQSWLDTWQGRFGLAGPRLHELSFDRAGRAGRLAEYRTFWRWTEAEYAWWSGRTDEVWDIVAPELAAAGRLGWGRLYRMLHIAARASHEPSSPADAERIVRDLLEPDRPGVSLGRALRPLAVAELDDTVEAWQAAIEALAGPAGPVYLRPYARLRLAKAYVAAKDRAAAAEPLELAASEADRMGMYPLAGQVAALRQRIGAAGPGGGVLTPREYEVLTLVADGRSNAQIGRELFISTKTVSVHVSNIIAKLEANNRGDAAARARRAGLLEPVPAVGS
ncbi:helix-turn-helix transcriptional regulator [Microlunatus sp. Y2014]|uniref:helix-turn-helix transcriptional regulator n=1 Tax=Microlunatus sp. Y2014 TaxID=3418488 RepID=UPI003DA71D2A